MLAEKQPCRTWRLGMEDDSDRPESTARGDSVWRAPKDASRNRRQCSHADRPDSAAGFHRRTPRPKRFASGPWKTLPTCAQPNCRDIRFRVCSERLPMSGARLSQCEPKSLPDTRSFECFRRTIPARLREEAAQECHRPPETVDCTVGTGLLRGPRQVLPSHQGRPLKCVRSSSRSSSAIVTCADMKKTANLEITSARLTFHYRYQDHVSYKAATCGFARTLSRK